MVVGVDMLFLEFVVWQPSLRYRYLSRAFKKFHQSRRVPLSVFSLKEYIHFSLGIKIYFQAMFILISLEIYSLLFQYNWVSMLCADNKKTT
jgi:hypothetical protein